MATSTIPTVLGLIYTRLAARPGLAPPVLVSYGPPVGAGSATEIVYVGDADGEQRWACLGTLRRNDHYTVEVVCSVVNSGGDSRVAAERAFALIAEVEDELRDDVDLAGAVIGSEVGRVTLQQLRSDRAAEARVTLGIPILARI